MTAHARRIIKVIAAALFVLLLAGFTYQGVATALERRAFKYPGRLVPVGDHQLHIHCIGAGLPTIVLEAPALGFSESWSAVQPELARVARVCAYDRHGLGWSEGSDGRFRSAVVADELHTLLGNAGETGPFVLVGDGLGAAYVTQYAVKYANETAALVLVDAPADAAPRPSERRTPPSPWLARIGILRLSYVLAGNAPGVPGPSGGAVRAFSMRPDHLTRAGQELAQYGVVARAAHDIALPPALAVRRLESPDSVSMLASAERAQPLIAAIVAAVREVRRD